MNSKQASGVFKRERPRKHFKIDGLPEGWFAIRHDHFPLKKDRRDGHGKWFEIKSEFGVIYRLPKFAPDMMANEILLDWEGWLNLNGRQDLIAKELNLTIRPMGSREVICSVHKIINSFPNASYRLAGYLAFYLGGGLGSLSVILGIISLVATFWPRE